ncbi:MAG: hypothetical protein COT31_02135 [Candidatus Moranbacteria bacterium CG08_land_8_20_14_0_20_34_16]|nr:MAG: hypothetical protein COT31_02135 [Candidatus Moranbacteria bacterium CG08_land_8_20_14_0_20_34_16]
MQNKIKKFFYAISSTMLFFPFLVLGQYMPPAETGLPVNSVYNVVEGIMKWLLAIVGIAGVIGFAIAGILYLTAAGDDTRMGQAKKAMLYSIIGVVVALAGLVALQFAFTMWSGTAKF